MCVCVWGRVGERVGREEEDGERRGRGERGEGGEKRIPSVAAGGLGV